MPGIGIGNRIGGSAGRYFDRLVSDFDKIWQRNSVLLHDFQTNVTPVNGTITYDTDIYYSGVRSLKITTDVSLKYGTARIDVGVDGVDLSAGYLIMMTRKPLQNANISSIQLNLRSAALTSLATCNRSYGGNINYSTDRWELNTFDINTPAIISATVRYIDITVGTTSITDLVSVYFNQLRIVNKTDTGYVTFSLAGAYIEQYTQIKPLLDAKGYKACLLLSHNIAIDANDIEYMTLAQLEECKADGWDITNHSGINVADATEQELINMCLYKKNWLSSHGFGSKNGSRFIGALESIWDELASETLSKYFLFVTAGNSMVMDSAYQSASIPIFNRKGINAIASNAGWDDIQSHINIIAAQKNWGIVQLHSPDETGSQLTYQQISDLIDLIHTLGIQVVTFSDVADNILKLGVSEPLPIAPSDLSLTLISGGVKVDWTDNSEGVNQHEIWLKKDSGEYELKYIIEKGIATKSCVISPVDLLHCKIRSRSKNGYSVFAGEASIVMLGDELIPQSTWAAIDYSLWYYHDPCWTADGTKITCNGTGAIRIWGLFSIGNQYRVKSSYTFTSGTRFNGWTNSLTKAHLAAGEYVDIIETVPYGTNDHVYIQATSWVGSINALSIKKVLMP